MRAAPDNYSIMYTAAKNCRADLPVRAGRPRTAVPQPNKHADEGVGRGPGGPPHKSHGR